MSGPATLLSLAGVDTTPCRLDAATLVLIDCQNEYVDGLLPLHGVNQALDEIAVLLAAARDVGAPVVHVVHKGRAGGPFDLDARGGAIAAAAAPLPGETVVVKTLPNAFTVPDLAESLAALGRRKLVVAGFQTHMCVSATVRAALDHGFWSTVVASACATRDLPSVLGGVMPATLQHAATLTALSDRFAAIARTSAEVLPEGRGAGQGTGRGMAAE